MSEIKEKLAKEFPGYYTVLLPTIHDHLRRLLKKYPLSPQEQEELTSYVASLPDAKAEEFLS